MSQSWYSDRAWCNVMGNQNNSNSFPNSHSLIERQSDTPGISRSVGFPFSLQIWGWTTDLQVHAQVFVHTYIDKLRTKQRNKEPKKNNISKSNCDFKSFRSETKQRV